MTLFKIIDAAISEQITAHVHPEVIAASVLKKLKPALFADSAPAASVERKQFFETLLPLVRARLELRKADNLDEYEQRVTAVFQIVVKTYNEFGATPQVSDLVYFGFRGLHSDLFALRGKQVQQYRKRRAFALLLRAEDFLGNQICEA
jgi:hypothetical protein